MANHLSPTDLARMLGLDRQEVLAKCREYGVPVFHGQIDKTLFLATLREQEAAGTAVGQGDKLSSSPRGGAPSSGGAPSR